MMSFKNDFRKEREKHIRAAQEVVKLAAIEMVNFVITFSAVGNPEELWKTKKAPKGYVGGRFRSNWFLTKSKPSVKVNYDFDSIRSEGAIIQEYSARILGEYAEKWILTNNLDYAKPIDNGTASTQNPNGVTAPARLHVNSKIPELTRIANQKYGIS